MSAEYQGIRQKCKIITSPLTTFMSARSSFAAFLATASRLHGSRMLIDAMRIVAGESGFTLVEHKLGFTAYRPNDDRYLLFCLSTGAWAIYGAATAIEVPTASGI